MPQAERRDFLKLTLLGALTALPCRSFADTGQNVAGTAAPVADRQQLLAAFDGIVEGAQQVWQAEVGDARAEWMADRARARYAELVPNLPDVGGDANLDAPFIPIAAWYVALYQPMRAAGMRAEDVGLLVYQLYQMELGRRPAADRQAEGDAWFGAANRQKLEHWAAWTQRRDYPGNWVATFVAGDGRHFDFGYDYSECGVVKYLRAQGVAELAPFVCLNDFSKSAALGTGLERHKTLAQGDDHCDFRFRRGRPVTQNWQTEIVLIRQRLADADNAPPSVGS